MTMNPEAGRWFGFVAAYPAVAEGDETFAFGLQGLHALLALESRGCADVKMDRARSLTDGVASTRPAMRLRLALESISRLKSR
jgi:hypothetical protein